MAQFYNLEEAARVLGISPEELKQRAQQREIRAFQGSGTWQFRAADVDEYARQMGQGSHPDLSLTDLEMPRNPDDADVLDLSEFQLGAVGADVAQQSIDMRPNAGRAPAASTPMDTDDVLLFDDMSAPDELASPSSSRIIGMNEPEGKRPTDSDVRLLPRDEGRSSDSDVRVGLNVPSRGPSDSDVSLSSVDALPALGSAASSGSQMRKPPSSSDTAIRAGISDSSQEINVAATDHSDFELTPSSIIESGLQPDSGSDFELPLLEDQSDEFAPTPVRQPADSDVTAVGMGASGIGIGKPSDSGINLQALGAFGPDTSGSIELAPLSGSQVKPSPRPTPAAKAPAAKAPAAKAAAEKDIFSDTDFELDVKAGETMQLEESDFNLSDSSIDDESGSEIISLAGEDDVDANAATAMRAPILEEEQDLFAGSEYGEGDSGAGMAAAESEGEIDWNRAGAGGGAAAASVAAAPPVAVPSRLSTPQQVEWGGLWVGLLGVSTVLSALVAFLALDFARNMHSWRGETPVASGIIKAIAGMFGG